jgi:hypothetical protein
MSSNYEDDNDDRMPLDDESPADENDYVDENDVDDTFSPGDNGNARSETARPSSVRPPPRPPRRPRVTQQPSADRSDPCVMIGPTRSGKTTLLLAFGSACTLSYGDGLKLEFVPEENTALKMKETIDRITGRRGGPQATEGKPGEYPFWIHVSEKPKNFWEVPLDRDLYMMMGDAGGGFSFPEDELTGPAIDFRDELMQMARNAGSLVFCVDVTKPRASVLERELPVLLSRITTPVDVRVPVPWQQRLRDKLLRQRTPEVRIRRMRRLNVSRFLLLLTQVDKLCHKLDKPAWFASTIDPVEQVRELLGLPLLNSIQSALKPGTSFAAGICSAWGFHPVTGRPFADQNGKPINLAAETGEEILRRWTPFGIRDAIYFIATGKCRGTVKQVMPHDLEVSGGHEAMEFSYHSIKDQTEAES